MVTLTSFRDGREPVDCTEGIPHQLYHFGKALLDTNDLDPLYNMLWCANIPPLTMERFIIAYSLYYHAGVAAKCAEAPDSKFWSLIRYGMDNKWPRGTERRHWRGKAAYESYKNISSVSPRSLFAHWMTPYPHKFQSIFTAVQVWTGFGPWIAFKVADLIDRVYTPVYEFEKANLAIYKDPKKGAALFLYGDQEQKVGAFEVDRALERIIVGFDDRLAPPRYERKVNIQEAETILCKFKSHYNGHYPVGKDTREILHALEGWGDLAQELSRCPLLMEVK